MRSRTRLLALVAFAVAFGLLAGLAIAGDNTPATAAGQKLDTKAEKTRGAGPDPNIKVDGPQNSSPVPNTQAPPEKGGEKSRGGCCWQPVDNYTGYWVNIYIDGRFSGTVAPWGYGNAYNCGSTLYATAPDTPLSWGPVRFCCGTWNLYP